MRSQLDGSMVDDLIDRLVGTPKDPSLNSILCRVAAHYGAPICLVSLVHSRGLRFMASVGTDALGSPRAASGGGFNICELPCQRECPTVILDARSNQRFKNDSLVIGPPHVRMYLGAPLKIHASNGGGIFIGTLCVLDPLPRTQLGLRDCDYLVDMSHAVVQHLERCATSLPKTTHTFLSSTIFLVRLTQSMCGRELSSPKSIMDHQGASRIHTSGCAGWSSSQRVKPHHCDV